MSKSFSINQEVRRLVKELLAQAKGNELKITADLQAIASEISAEIVGLENKFKTEVSLIRKLLLLAEKDRTNKSFEQKLKKFARLNNDTLRYTFIFPNDKYVQGFHNAIKKLKQSGFTIPPNRIWNAWENVETARDTGYRGINVTIISSQNQRFELQLHTKASFRFKTETHHLYKELRDLKVSDERRKAIVEEMLRLTKEVAQPGGK